jgi:beta-lactamase class A
MKRLTLSAILLIFFLTPRYVMAQQEPLLRQIKDVAKPAKGIVGVSILGLESRDTLNYNGNSRLVMHSVMKFPIAMTVLHLIDKGKYKLDQQLKVSKKDLLPNTHSPLRDKYPEGTEISLGELLGYMVSQSDNNACDFLLKKIGGTRVVEDYIQSLGIKGIAVNATEAEMAASWEVQYLNWCKPVDVVRLLDIYYQGKALSKTSNDFLWKIMTETSTGPNRIKGLLPKAVIVAHKTGSSPTNDAGLSPATNDVGIITLPNGKHLAIAIFVCNSTADEATRELVIAKIAKAAWDYYSK